MNKLLGKAHQKWHINFKEAGCYTISPAHDPSLALTAAQGGTTNGTAIVLEKDGQRPSQLWSLTKHDNGSYSLLPKHALEQGLDHFAGKPVPGAQAQRESQMRSS